MKNAAILFFILFFHSAFGQQTIDKLNANQLKLPKESVNKALYLDGAGQVKSSSTISDTELGYLEGLTDTLVNLLSGKANDTDVVKLTGNQSVDGVKTFTGKLVASSTVNGSIPCPVMTEAERDLFTPVEGDCVYNSDTLKLNIFDGSVWKDVGGAGGISLWLTANPYNVNDIIIESDKIYRCLVAHTSGVFATDLAAAKWTEVSASPVTPYSLNDGGTNKALTAVNGGIVWVDADSFEILAAGVSGQVLQSNGAASPSWVNKSISGKAENASSITLEEIQVSNNQLTQTDTNKHLVETGNTNILVNPSFEHSTFSTGWANALGTFAAESTVVVHGKKSAKVTLSSQALDLSQDSTLYQAQFADGVQGLASVRVKTTVSGIRVCSRQNGVVSSNLCVNVQANGKWGLYKVPFTLGGTSNGIEIDSNSVSVTGDVYVDNAFVGAVDLSADVDQSTLVGGITISGCSFTNTSTSFADLSTVSGACTYSVFGSALAPSSTIPAIRFNSLSAGEYRIEYSGAVTSQRIGATSSDANFRIFDGTNTSREVVAVQATTSGDNAWSTSPTASWSINYSSNQGPLTLSIQGKTINASFGYPAIGKTANTTVTGTIRVYRIAQGTTYSSTNADTDWQSCGHTPSSFTGFGTVSAIETQCKREGSDLLMKGKFTSGLPTAVEARVNLPIWNGVQLASAGTQKIPSLQLSGSSGRSGVASSTQVHQTIIESSVSYITFSNQIGSNYSHLSKRLGTELTSNGELYSFTARIPIEGWENSNIIIGQFNGLESCTNSYECTDVFSAKVSLSGIVTGENIDWINGNCTNVGNVFTCTHTSGVFTTTPNCTITNDNGNTAAQVQWHTSSTSISTVYSTTNSAGTATAGAVNIICQKQGVDYIGKTAKAVASDQNLRTPGVTKSVLYSAKIATTGTVSKEKGSWINGNCTNATPQVCTFESTAFLSGSEVNCWLSNAVNSSAAFYPCYPHADPTSASVQIRCSNASQIDSTTSVDKYLYCHGESP